MDERVEGDSGTAADADGSPLAALPDPALVIDTDGAVVACNALAVELFGRDPTGDSVASLLTHADITLKRDEPLRRRAQGRHGDHVPFIVDISVAATEWAPGRRLVLLRELDARLLVAESSRLLDVAFESSPIGLGIFNPEGEYIRANAALCRLLDRPLEDLIGRRDQELTHPDDRASDVEAAWRILDGEIHTWQTEKRFVRPNGDIVWAIASMTFLRDEDGNAVAWLGQIQDITERKSLEGRLRRLADEDPLTSVPNRRTFEEAVRLTLELSARHEIGGALLMIDLDGFKQVNDTYGHAVGDAVLTAVARTLKGRLRATDLLARVGGDEFAVLLRATTAQSARSVADALADVVRETMLGPEGPQIPLAVSIGVAEFGTHPLPTVQELLRTADDAMYATKRAAREARD